jgi:hypothetical protein
MRRTKVKSRDRVCRCATAYIRGVETHLHINSARDAGPKDGPEQARVEHTVNNRPAEEKVSRVTKRCARTNQDEELVETHFLNLVFAAYSGSRWTGLSSPASFAYCATSAALNDLVKVALVPTGMCPFAGLCKMEGLGNCTSISRCSCCPVSFLFVSG